ncbi:hypothetical protein CO154_01930 [Candidatus Pacearchaeota archaeon CG_4_9_14_3_um_filter_31_7]|nr:MAG: hypothetical protein AUJ10_03340 [Candidatus Pacearchaeota archaeon CG1_02_31_27]PIN92441.1 MAG: hypothetical protein COU55_01400 [Candidatus Pacearchaeota archaeon CG10_big_fil_rev_8_21_14_0_10_31_59]PJA70630.1 MAG: hypothetical protein CO154_01930 [Candidatus Pacearchaeota archaeon CG_4_9_14_3_um_filter_31_7]
MQEIDENRIEKASKKAGKLFKPIKYLINVLIIVIILFLILELISFVVIKIHSSPKNEPRLQMDIYNNKTWAVDYYIEFYESDKAEYFPYLEYRRVPNYHGEYINIDENSIRKTESSCFIQSDDRIRIFIFGGSTLWGSGARDEGTIPSFVLTYLCENKIAAEVINFGEAGYGSTQEIIRLELELRKENKPDIVIFYDGVNEVYSAYQNKKAGLPQNVQNRIEDFNSRNRINLKNALVNSNLVRIINKLIGGFKKEKIETLPESLDDETANVYLENVKLVKILAEEYDFKTFFYWQPSVYSKDNLSEDEKNKIAKDETYKKLYFDVKDIVDESQDVIDISDVFDEHYESIFIDPYHTSEEGNKIIVGDIGKDIIKYLNENQI